MTLNPASGGSYQYAVDFARHLLACDTANEYVLFYDDDVMWEQEFDNPNVTLVPVERPKRTYRMWVSAVLHLYRLLRAFLLPLPANLTKRKLAGFVRELLDWRHVLGMSRYLQIERYIAFSRAGLDLLIQPAHGFGAFFSGLPYIISIHDFPSQWTQAMQERVASSGIMLAHLHVRALSSRAGAIFVDSSVSKDQLSRDYRVPLGRIHVLPFRPPSYLNPAVAQEDIVRVRQKYDLPDMHFFYPADIWPQKNHIGLVNALVALRDRHHIAITLVLTGQKGPAFEALMRRVDELDLSAQVRYLGYVDVRDLSALYKSAMAVVMPTLIGPTNIPVVEAFLMGCPVICSKVAGYEEQVGDAGLLIDPLSTDELVDAMYRIYTDQSLRQLLVERGYQRISALLADDYGGRIIEVVRQVLEELH